MKLPIEGTWRTCLQRHIRKNSITRKATTQKLSDRRRGWAIESRNLGRGRGEESCSITPLSQLLAYVQSCAPLRRIHDGIPIILHYNNNITKRLRWSRGSVVAFGTQVRGFKPGRSRQIFGAEKILSTPSLGGEVNPSVPCRNLSPFLLRLPDNILAHSSTLRY